MAKHLRSTELVQLRHIRHASGNLFLLPKVFQRSWHFVCRQIAAPIIADFLGQFCPIVRIMLASLDELFGCQLLVKEIGPPAKPQSVARADGERQVARHAMCPRSVSEGRCATN